MTELRDARLRKALDEAPDARLQPHPRTRDAIRAGAHAAVQPAWRRWFTTARAHPTPWAAAFATVAVATLVTVTWQDREPPGAQPDTEAPVAARAPAPAPSASVAAPAPPPATQDSAGLAATAPAPSPASRPAPMRQREAEPQRHAEAPRKASPPAREARAHSESAPRAAPAPTPSPAPAPAPAPAAVPEAPPAPAATADVQRGFRPTAPRPPSGALPWTQVRIESDGKSVVVPRPQAGALPALVTTLLASTSDEAEAGSRGGLRLELAQGDQALGVLELVGERWRWTPLGESGQARWVRADPQVSERLHAEAQRLLQR